MSIFMPTLHMLYISYLVGNVDAFADVSVYPGLTVFTGETTRPRGMG